VGVRVGVALYRNKLALRRNLRNLDESGTEFVNNADFPLTLNLSGAFKQLNEGFNSVCAQFNNKKLLTESPKRKKTSLAAGNIVNSA